MRALLDLGELRGGSAPTATETSGPRRRDPAGADAALTGASDAVRGGDVDGDGYADVHLFSDDGTGSVYVLIGGSTRYSGTIDVTTGAATTLSGGATSSGFGAGHAVGDLGGDGDGDLAIGDRGDDTVATDAGAVWVFSGPLATGALTSADASAAVYGEAAGEYTGYDAVAIGRVTGGTLPDLIAGAYQADGGAGRLDIHTSP